MDNDYKFMTYKEASAALSKSIDSVRAMAMRQNWKKSKNNRKQVIIGVPIERLETKEEGSLCHDIDMIPINHSHVSDQTLTNQVHELQKQIAVLSVELKHANEKIELLDKQTEDFKSDRDAWREQAKTKKSWFWRRAI